MNNEESILIAKRLQKEYANLSTLMIIIKESEARLADLKDPAPKDRHILFYYWPNILVAVVTYLIVAKLHELWFMSESFGFQLFLVILRFGAPSLVLILGLLYSLSLKRNADIQDRIAHQSYLIKKRELEKEKLELGKKYADLKTELAYYDNIVPPAYQNAGAMKKVIEMLKNGEADTFEQAMDKLIFK